MFGSGLPAGAGLQVDKHSSSDTANVYVPPPPPSTHGEGYPHRSPPFFGTWENPIGMGVQGKPVKRYTGKKKKSKGKGFLLGKNSPFNSVPILGAIL